MGRKARMVEIKSPKIIEAYYDEDRLKKIVSSVNSLSLDDWIYDPVHHRYRSTHPYSSKLAMFELDRAREEFKNDKLLFTYSVLCYYNEKDSVLYKHKDGNACTYTIDLCLYSKKPWPLIIENEEYVLNSNDAVLFYGEDQLHWRNPMGEDNSVLLLFMHFADRDHWWFQANNKDCI